MLVIETEITLNRVSSNIEFEADREDWEERDESEENEGKGPSSVSASQPAAKADQGKKRARQRQEVFLEAYLARKETRQMEREKEQKENDDIHHYVLNLTPQLRRLPLERQSCVRLKISGPFMRLNSPHMSPQPNHPSHATYSQKSTFTPL